MITFPNCKINLGLNITNRRTDGYHDIETIFYPVYLRDVLEIVETNESSTIKLTGKEVIGDSKNNLVWKAYELIQKRFPNKVPELSIFLHKNIPMGAGLGGGSADGAFMLRLINDYCKLSLSEKKLAILALELGSDCPFFIYNSPQFAIGRGELMQPIHIDLSNYSIQLICPEIHVNTANAFKMINPQKPSFNLQELPKYPVKDWQGLVKNDFESPIFNLHPELEDLKKQLYHHGALYASMSGSGSTIFGIFSKGNRAIIKSNTKFEEYFIA